MFKQLNRCKAEYNVIMVDECIIYQLISYNARVMQAIYNRKYDNWHIALNERYYMYSPTTIQHVYKFIAKCDIPHFYLSYVRDNAHGITSDVSVLYDSLRDIEISVYSDKAFNRIWR